MANKYFMSLVLGLFISSQVGYAQEPLAKTLKEPIRLSFHIAEIQSQKPLAGAWLMLYEGEKIVSRWLADSSGNLSVNFWSEARVKVAFGKEDYLLETVFLEPGNANTNERRKIVLIHESWYKFQGTLLDNHHKVTLKHQGVKLVNLITGEEFHDQTDQWGIYTFFIDPRYDYELVTMAKGYLNRRTKINCNCSVKTKYKFCTQGFSALDVGRDPETDLPFIATTTMLEEKKIDKTYRVDNIYYDYNKAKIRKDAEPVLNGLYTLLHDNPDIKIELRSHTDSRGSRSFNQNLSQNRAESAVDYLIQKGIPSTRLIPKGYGESKLVNGCKDGKNCPESEHEKNRRTEFTIVEIMNN